MIEWKQKELGMKIQKGDEEWQAGEDIGERWGKRKRGEQKRTESGRKWGEKNKKGWKEMLEKKKDLSPKVQ